jgi:hypothetical protein
LRCVCVCWGEGEAKIFYCFSLELPRKVSFLVPLIVFIRQDIICIRQRPFLSSPRAQDTAIEDSELCHVMLTEHRQSQLKYQLISQAHK